MLTLILWREKRRTILFLLGLQASLNRKGKTVNDALQELLQLKITYGSLDDFICNNLQLLQFRFHLNLHFINKYEPLDQQLHRLVFERNIEVLQNSECRIVILLLDARFLLNSRYVGHIEQSLLLSDSKLSLTSRINCLLQKFH